MIDASKFAGGYSSFWRGVAPTTDVFIRRLNSELCERIDPPMDYELSAGRSALISEAAFSLLHIDSHAIGYMALSNSERFETAVEIARGRLKLLMVDGLNEEVDDAETRIIAQLFTRLRRYFIPKSGSECIVRPVFSGCGFIDASEGDIIYDRAIFEVKVVDRSFRSSDLKQVISYAALNYKARNYTANAVGLFNPRRGVGMKIDLDEVSMEIAGCSATDLMEAIIYEIAGGDISR